MSHGFHIRIMEESDKNHIALLHGQELSGFLTELGERFLRLFYEKSMEVPEMFTFVVERDEGVDPTSPRLRGARGKEGLERVRVVGFVTGVTSVNGLYKKILMKSPFRFGILLLRYIVTHPQKIIKITQALTYPGFSGDGAELLTLVVDKDYRNQGIGKKLFLGVAEEFKRRGIKEFRISAYDRLPANGFYKKLGCQMDRSFEFLGERMNYYSFSF